MTNMRIGHGYDVHAFATGKPLILGGVNIPSAEGMRAHSDGDVVMHSLCDSLLGAAALGDIGQHFPDTDPQYANTDSSQLLAEVVSLVYRQGYRLTNADITIIAERPKLAPYLPDMAQNLARILMTEPRTINLKATTHEGLGSLGQGLGIAVHSVVLLHCTR